MPPSPRGRGRIALPRYSSTSRGGGGGALAGAVEKVTKNKGLAKVVKRGAPALAGTWIAEGVASTGMDIAKTVAEIKVMERKAEAPGPKITEVKDNGTQADDGRKAKVDQSNASVNKSMVAKMFDPELLKQLGTGVFITGAFTLTVYLLYNYITEKIDDLLHPPRYRDDNDQDDLQRTERDRYERGTAKDKFIRLNEKYASCLDTNGNVIPSQAGVAEACQRAMSTIMLEMNLEDV